ncbi:basic proline-rich protein-like [Leopardus geoffroyi]|uniref:basic proline-rich protein-like n=1 Tax=Leopardus geoffroyi TaxID=46844 RepID=UPI001E262C21|nr:basic proline-rich protein-like [Leopardus geoffroyi]
MGTEQETPRPRDGHTSEPAFRSQSSPRAPPGRPHTSARGSQVPGSLGPRPKRFLEGACPGSAGRTAGVSRCVAAAPCGASRVQPVPSPAWRALSAPGFLSARARPSPGTCPLPSPQTRRRSPVPSPHGHGPPRAPTLRRFPALRTPPRPAAPPPPAPPRTRTLTCGGTPLRRPGGRPECPRRRLRRGRGLGLRFAVKVREGEYHFREDSELKSMDPCPSICALQQEVPQLYRMSKNIY